MSARWRRRGRAGEEARRRRYVVLDLSTLCRDSPPGQKQTKKRFKKSLPPPLIDVEKQRANVTSSLVDALRIVRDKYDAAVARLGAVESEAMEGTARIEAT